MSESTPIPQEELDCVWRNEWVRKMLELLEPGVEIRFLVQGEHHISLATVKLVSQTHGWDISCGMEHTFTYRLSQVCSFFEEIYDRKMQVISIYGEVEIPIPIHHTEMKAEEK